ncbi:MAG: hypothetical protein ACI8UD_003951, partial [Planctomycetota bacterium]
MISSTGDLARRNLIDERQCAHRVQTEATDVLKLR